MRYRQTQEHPESKANGDSRRGAARVAADTTVTGITVAACACRPACSASRCRNLRSLAVGVMKEISPTNTTIILHELAVFIFQTTPVLFFRFLEEIP